MEGKTEVSEEKGTCSCLFSELVAEKGKKNDLLGHVFLPEKADILLENRRFNVLSA